VFLLACANIWRAAGLARQSELLIELGTSLPPVIPLSISLIWAATFCYLVCALWRRRRSAGWLLPIAILVYAGYRLLLLLVFAVEPLTRHTWPIQFVPLAALSLYTAWALNRRSAAAFWRTRARHGVPGRQP
jgi:hypothetical protein